MKEASKTVFVRLFPVRRESMKKRSFGSILGRVPPNPYLTMISILVALFMSIPIIYVGFRGMFAGRERWLRLLDGRIPQLLLNTLGLTVVVVFFATVIGVSLAVAVTRCNVPGRKVFSWLLVLPLIIPPYVGAVTYVMIFGPTGPLGNWFQIYSFPGVAFVLTIFTYPYVFLVVRSALKRMNRNLEEAGRSLGLNTIDVFLKINLPLLRPSIGAGGILVALYVLSDFGAISMLRYNTFTSAIYYQMGGYDNVSATILSLVLILLTVGVLWLEGKVGRKKAYFQADSSYENLEVLDIGKWRFPLLALILIIIAVTIVLPIGVLLYWSWIGISRGALEGGFWGYLGNSLQVSLIAGGLSMVMAFPVVYLKSRYPSKFTTILQRLSYSGYALPGVIVALGIIFLFNQYIPVLYGSSFVIVVAYLIRFLPQSMQSSSASLEMIPPKIDEAARNLGEPFWKVIFTVILPLMLPGLFAGGALVFVSAMKELPATLLLRPPNFDTLAVRVWVEASEAVYHMAAPSALIIIIVSIIPIKFLLDKY